MEKSNGTSGKEFWGKKGRSFVSGRPAQTRGTAPATKGEMAQDGGKPGLSPEEPKEGGRRRKGPQQRPGKRSP